MEDFRLDIMIDQGPERPERPAAAQAVHADRGHHPERAPDGPAPVEVHAADPARLLRQGHARRHRPQKLRAARRQDRRRRRAGDRRPGARDPPDRQQPDQFRPGLRPGEGRRPDHPARRGGRSGAPRDRRGGARRDGQADPAGHGRELPAAARSGLGTIAIAVGEETDTLEEVHEPFLIQEGYLQRTPQGRVLTPKGYAAIGPQAGGRRAGQPALGQQARSRKS